MDEKARHCIITGCGAPTDELLCKGCRKGYGLIRKQGVWGCLTSGCCRPPIDDYFCKECRRDIEAMHHPAMVPTPPGGQEIIGRKDDSEKSRWDLFPFDALEEVARVLSYGAKKYEPENWRKVEGGRWRYFGAALRHLSAWWLGEARDPESGLSHLAHATCCVLFLLALESPKKE